MIDAGIGETRAALVGDGRIIEARILREGVVPTGTILAARLKHAGRNAVAIAGSDEYLLPRGAARITEGASLTIEVTREALGGGEPWKRPLARVTDEAPQEAPAIPGRQAAAAEFDEVGWLDLVDEARTGLIPFPGGELRLSLTPAMTLIDVDGQLPPPQLAIAAARAATDTIRRHGVGGSIGIDFPTVAGKQERQAVGEAIDAGLPKPFERTAVNGFGFLQIVRPRAHASLFELAADRAPFEARALLRSASRSVGAIRLVAHPAVIGVLEANHGWIARLMRQAGGTVTLRVEPSLAMSAGYAEPA